MIAAGELEPYAELINTFRREVIRHCDSGTLTDMPERSDFVEGERILTSSEGGAFPRGLIVGEVRKASGDWRVKYAMSEGSAGYVQLIPPPVIPEPLPAPDVPAGDETSPAASPTQGARQ